MATRLQLNALLCSILGSNHCYFQPPETLKMEYPAIVYRLDDIENLHADNGVYASKKRYSITLIDKNPDNANVDKIIALPTCRFDRHYRSDNLNHYVFTIYY